MTQEQPDYSGEITAPWSEEQVEALNAFQRAGRFHPFTCGNEHTGQRPMLVATTGGWSCPSGCGWEQAWAPAMMLDPRTLESPFKWRGGAEG